jgi:O-antigen/teichoic acid export membrane protein
VADFLPGRLLVRNVVLSITGNIGSGLVFVVVSPAIVNGLGIERYGLLALVWAVLGYFKPDWGIAQSTTMCVAKAIGENRAERVRPIVVTSLVCALGAGLVAGATLWLLVPALLAVLKISPGLRTEAASILRVSSVALAIPFLLGPLRGALAASQRFDVLNVLKLAGTLANAAVFLGAIRLGAGLYAIVVWLAIKDFAIWIAYAAWCHRSLPSGNGRVFDRSFVGELVSLGGWLNAYQFARLALQHLEPLVVGSVLTLAAVGYYAAPNQLVSMLSIIPGSVVEILFPAYCALRVASTARLLTVFRHGLRLQTLAVTGIAGVLIVFARPILGLWLGPSFAESVPVLRVLSVTFVIAAVASSFNNLLQAIGHIRTVTLLFVVLLPVHLTIAYVLTSQHGIVGAAWSGATVNGLALVSYVIVCWKSEAIDLTQVIEGRWAFAAVLLVTFVSGLTLLEFFYRPSALGFLVLAAILASGYFLIAWFTVLTSAERDGLLSWGTSIRQLRRLDDVTQ